MSTSQRRPYDPKLVLIGVRALRRRMAELMGDEWDKFSLQLDRHVAEAAAATGKKQEKLVAALLRLGFRSRARDVFGEIVANATTAAAMDALTRIHDNLELGSQQPSFEEISRQRYDIPRQEAEKSREREDMARRQDEIARYDNMRRSERREEWDRTHHRAAREELQTATTGEELHAATPTDEGRTTGEEMRTANGGGPRRGKRVARKKASGVRKSARRRGRKKAKIGMRTAGKRVARKRAMRPLAKRPVSPRMAAPELLPIRPKPARRKSRFVNLNFADLNGRAIQKKKPLVARRKYKLHVGIGDFAKESVVERSADAELRDDLLQPRTGGHWLQVAPVSDQFSISPRGSWLFLPPDGPAWSCKCTPGGAHRCKATSRRDHLEFSVRTPGSPGRATLRLTVYFEKSILQSLLLTATIARTAAGRGSNGAVVDYNLTSAPEDIELVQPRALSVMMNDADDGSHLMVFNGAPDEVVAIRLTDDQMTSAVTMMREVMRTIHIEDLGPRDSDKVNRYDKQNRKTKEKFIADLRRLAGHGYTLWSSLWQGQLRLWKEHRDAFVGNSDVIQIGRKEWSTRVFPWAMIYSLPIDIGAPQNNHLCRLLGEDEWKEFQKPLADVPSRCPFEATHGENVICPYGFWGFRYEIEQPPSVQPERSLPRVISVIAPPLNFVIALSDDLNQGLATAHLKALRAQHSAAFTIRECRTRSDIRTGLGMLDVEVVYFYCHGYSNPLPGNAGTMPTLGVGTREVIAPPDLTTWEMAWSDDHWQKRAPLVFINGCHTADTTPQTLVNFVDAFSATLDAAGVIGTEITLHQLVANEVGQTFLSEFQRGQTVGKSLRHARTELLRKGNLLGLVYTAYCSADLRLSAAVS